MISTRLDFIRVVTHLDVTIADVERAVEV